MLLVYAYIWLPSVQARATLSQSLIEKKSQLAQMQMQATQIQTLKSAINLSHGGASGLQTALNTSAKLHQVEQYISAMKVLEQGGVHVSLPSIRFDVWTKWAFALQTEHQIRIATAHIQALPSGLVQVEADLVTTE
jgi:type II secretory pathway component PulM